MLKNKIFNKNDNEFTIIYMLNYGQGGLCDFLKIGMHLIYICDKLKLNFKIKCNTALNNHIVIKDEFHYKDDILEDFYLKSTIRKYGVNKEINILDFFTNILKIHKTNTLIVEPNYLSGNIDYIKTPINFNFIDYQTNDTINQFSSILNFISFKKTALEKFNEIKNKYGDEYECFHLRCGDKYLETKPSCGYCISDNRMKNIKDYIEKIKEKIKLSNKPLFFFCDNKIVKNIIKKEIPKIICLDTKILHVGYIYNTCKDELDVSIEDTIVDFIILMNSKKNYSLSYSGFSIISSLLGNITLENV